jgi:hypothetical protein
MKQAWLVGAVGVVVVLGAALWKAEASPQKDAVAACHDAIGDKLISPATARYSGETIVGNKSPWLSLVDVDSQNGQGALIRSKWACTVTRADGRYDAFAELAH